MKNEKKLHEAIGLLQSIENNSRVDDAIKLIASFMIDNVKRNKGDLMCRDFVSTDKTRPVLHLIFHDSERKTAVATDAHALFTNQSEFIKTDGCGLRDIYGNEMKDAGVFPCWFKVIPTETQPTTIDADLEETYKKALSEAKLYGRQSNKTKIFILVNGKQWMTARHVGFMLRAGLDGWLVPKNSSNPMCSPLLKNWDGKQLLLMPTHIDATAIETKIRFKYVEKK